jgi:hypothetical protein
VAQVTRWQRAVDILKGGENFRADPVWIKGGGSSGNRDDAPRLPAWSVPAGAALTDHRLAILMLMGRVNGADKPASHQLHVEPLPDGPTGQDSRRGWGLARR